MLVGEIEGDGTRPNRRRHVAPAPSSTTAGVACGAAASGQYVWNDPTQVAQLLTCMMMSGPFLTGFTQTINDWYDREIDAINEPYRPIPSGACNQWQVLPHQGLRLGAATHGAQRSRREKAVYRAPRVQPSPC